MKVFRVQIETENAAFAPDATPEIVRLLRDVASKLESGAQPIRKGPLPIYDLNGNRVGQAALYT